MTPPSYINSAILPISMQKYFTVLLTVESFVEVWMPFTESTARVKWETAAATKSERHNWETFLWPKMTPASVTIIKK